MGIKLCTAKYILSLFRKEGKIYRKKGENFSFLRNADFVVEERDPKNIVYMPYPLYIFCFCSPEQMSINLGHLQQIWFPTPFVIFLITPIIYNSVLSNSLVFFFLFKNFLSCIFAGFGLSKILNPTVRFFSYPAIVFKSSYQLFYRILFLYPEKSVHIYKK